MSVEPSASRPISWALGGWTFAISGARGEGGGRVGDDRRADRLVRVVAKAGAEPSASLDDDLELQLFDEPRHAVRRECDPLLAGSGFGWYADFHEVAGVGARASRELTRAAGETLLSLKLRAAAEGANRSPRRRWGVTTCATLTCRASRHRRMKFDIPMSSPSGSPPWQRLVFGFDPRVARNSRPRSPLCHSPRSIPRE